MVTFQVDWSKAPEWANFAYITRDFKVIWSEKEMAYEGHGWSCPMKDNRKEVDDIKMFYGVHPQLKAKRP